MYPYADERREIMLILVPGEFNSNWLVETFDNADERLLGDSIA